MLYIIEKHHRTSDVCWQAIDETDFCVKVCRQFIDFDDLPQDADYRTCVDYLAGDLKNLIIVSDYETAKKYGYE